MTSRSTYLGSLLVSAAPTPQLLVAELGTHGYAASEWRAGWTRCTAASPRVPVGWAAQVLPHAHSVHAAAPALPKAIAMHVRARLLAADDSSRLRVHFVNARAALRGGAFVSAVVKATAATMPGVALPLHGRLAGDETLVQIAAVDASCAAVSLASPRCVPRAADCASLLVLSPFPAGQARLHGDDTSGRHSELSTAAGKLLHAELQLGARIGAGQRVLDLGCTPGSWSAVALERGATVDGVDRGVPALAHERFTFHRADVRQFPVTHNRFDWLLSDVVDSVDEIRALARRWLAPSGADVALERPLHFVFTLKHRQPLAEVPALVATAREAAAWMANGRGVVGMRHLASVNTPNEVMMFGRLHATTATQQPEQQR